MRWKHLCRISIAFDVAEYEGSGPHDDFRSVYADTFIAHRGGAVAACAHMPSHGTFCV